MIATGEPGQCLRQFAERLRQDTFLMLLVAALLPLALASAVPLSQYPSLVDLPTIAALTGLLLLTKGLELSGALDRLGHALVDATATERATALCLVGMAAALSTLLTNDVALFVVVPLTLGVCRITGLPATRLIVFEALAVNAGSMLTPIGNPQNLFLWQLGKPSFGAFVLHMLPLVAALMAALLLLTALVFRSQPVKAHRSGEPAALDRPLLVVSLALYVPFLIAADLHQAAPAALALLVVFLLLRRQVLAQLDWGLLLVFVLMFIDLRLLAGLDLVRQAMQGLGLELAPRLYFAGVVASQFISNVPAAIALAEYSQDWRVIAYGVNVGGFGFMVGSLANLIALRLAGDPRGWLMFHAYAVPFLALAAALGYGLLFIV